MSETVNTLTIQLSQFQPALDSTFNLDQVASAVTSAHTSGAHLVIFPEYSHSFGPDQGEEWVSRAEQSDGPFVSALSRLSDQAEGMLIIAGMLEKFSTGRPHNTLVCVHDTGVVGKSQKIHLYDAFGHVESDWLAPAAIADPEIVALGPWRIGMQTCYDLRFPEVSRRLVDAGANLIVIPAQWVPGPLKLEQWRTLLMARAIETQCFVVAVGQPAPSGVGHSMVVSPRGEVVAEAGESPTDLLATIEASVVEAVRGENPMAEARRFGVVWKR
jgi:predicted amidohydrolase